MSSRMDLAQGGEAAAHLVAEEGQHLLDLAEEAGEIRLVAHIGRVARLEARAVIGEAEGAVAARAPSPRSGGIARPAGVPSGVSRERATRPVRASTPGTRSRSAPALSNSQAAFSPRPGSAPRKPTVSGTSSRPSAQPVRRVGHAAEIGAAVAGQIGVRHEAAIDPVAELGQRPAGVRAIAVAARLERRSDARRSSSRSRRSAPRSWRARARAAGCNDRSCGRLTSSTMRRRHPGMEVGADLRLAGVAQGRAGSGPPPDRWRPDSRRHRSGRCRSGRRSRARGPGPGSTRVATLVPREGLGSSRTPPRCRRRSAVRGSQLAAPRCSRAEAISSARQSAQIAAPARSP